MKKYLRIFTVIVFLFILFRFFFFFLYKGRVVNYSIKENNNKYLIHEEYIRNEQQVTNHYYLEVNFDKKIFNFRIADIFYKKSYIIEEIYSFQNEQYTCVLPIFIDNSIQTDIMCLDGNTLYPYRSLKNKSFELDSFAISMEKYGYENDEVNDKLLNKYGVDILKNNLVSSHKVIIPSYNGLFIIDEQEQDIISSVELFKNDTYNQAIQSVVSNYYVVADYDSLYSFHKFILVNLDTKKISTIISDSSISMDSYVQGVVEDSMYIIDRSNKKQYKIDVSKKSVSLVGNSKRGILYYDGNEFQNRSIYDALTNDLLFETYFYDSPKYDYVHLEDGIYYSYLRVNDGYEVYVSYKENPSLYTYGFFVSSIDHIQYLYDYVYYEEDACIYYYNPKIGVTKLLTYTELFYNSNLNFWVYKK